jgi:hypothetical protein
VSGLAFPADLHVSNALASATTTPTAAADEGEMMLHLAKLAEKDEAVCHALLSEVGQTLRGELLR